MTAAGQRTIGQATRSVIGLVKARKVGNGTNCTLTKQDCRVWLERPGSVATCG